MRPPDPHEITVHMYTRRDPHELILRHELGSGCVVYWRPMHPPGWWNPLVRYFARKDRGGDQPLWK